MPEERNFKKYVKARAELDKRLAKAGIPESEYLNLLDLLETVTETYLEDARQSQFFDDANELAISIQAATEKKIRQVSTYLRNFAEHIVKHACNIQDDAKIQSIVDSLPQMNDGDVEEIGDQER